MHEAPTNRWDEVDRLFHAAQAYQGDARVRFLDDACAGDAALREEIESLLHFDTGVGSFLERTALDEAARAMAHEPPSLLGREIGGYQIIEAIGAGGMGEVYRARDQRLGRDVALKVLAPAVAGDPVAIDDVAEEARSASLLNHPNIVTVYGVGGDDAIAYIAMELVQGRTLTQLLADDPPSHAAALELAVQCADALAAAHTAGLIHRDLKPDNVMVTPAGLLKVLDFGIAKRRAAPGSTPARDPVERADTTSGKVFGTIGYMSPEQAQGLPVDHRSDQYAFGVMLREMFTGRRAFARTPAAATVSAIADGEPPSLPGVRPTIARLIARCLAKDPAARYADTRDLAAELRRIRADEQRPAGLTRRRVLWYGVAAAAVAGAAAWKLRPAPPSFNGIAVRPFANTASDPDTQFLCEGLVTVLVEWLWRLPALRVVPASAVFSLAPRGLDAVDAGRLLHADAVVDGTVTRANGRLRISARLVDVTTGRTRWTSNYDRDEGDLVAIQQDLAHAIAQAVGVELGVAERERLDRSTTITAAANAHYLRALYEIRQETEDGYLSARDLLLQAIEADPQFARAFATLASTYSVCVIDGYERPLDAWIKSAHAVRQALRLDPELPIAHAEAATMAFMWDWDWSQAEHEFAVALASRVGELEPDLLSACALEHWARGRADEALRYIALARNLDPVSAAYAVREADLRLHRADLTTAARVYAEVIRDWPLDPRAHLGLAELERRRGQFDAALASLRRGLELSQADADPRMRTALATAQGAGGYRNVEQAAAQAQLDEYHQRREAGDYVSPLDVARAEVQLDHADRAFAALDSALDERAAGLVFLKVDTVWDPVRADARFASVVTRVGV